MIDCQFDFIDFRPTYIHTYILQMLFKAYKHPTWIIMIIIIVASSKYK